MLGHYRNATTGVEIDAVQLTPENVKELASMTHGLQVEEIDALDSNKRFVGLNIPTPDGVRRASEGDFLILWDGQWFVGKPGRFQELWDEA